MASDKTKDLLTEGRTAFERCQEAEQDNRTTALDDIRFSRLEEQWPDSIRKQRDLEQRPSLTINKMPAFIRQVVNDSRQNRPSIKVHPVDSEADPKTAEVINGLIRNIEYTSNADVAYDTAIEASVSGGFGYWRIGLDYAYDDTFELDLSIDRIANQFAVYGDPDSMSADSADWNVAFVVEPMRKDDYKSRYKGKKAAHGDDVCIDFESDAWSNAGTWLDDETVMLAEWWSRKEVDREIVKCSNGAVYGVEELETNPFLSALLTAGAIQVVGKPRLARSHKVTQRIMSGADIIDEKEWLGRYIPIVPVYGDEIVVEGKRYFRSLIHSAKDAQRMFNYWRSTSTELVALAPRVPFIGPKGAFNTDAERWATANTVSHSYLEYDGMQPPTRQPLDVGPAAGALQEALNASDDMKAIIGIHDASLGARSNETSGKAIMARQREGDVATFHFIDNLSRAIRHTGRILIDLIPKVYSEERIIRVLGEDGVPKTRRINTPEPVPQMGPDGQPEVDNEGNPIAEVYNLTAGKYDLTVSSGPSFTTRREEAAFQMTEFMRAFPPAAPIIGDLLAKNLDWPGADEIAERLKSINPALQQQQQQQGLPPEVQQMIEQSQQAIQQLTQEVESLKADKSIDQFNADTERMKVQGDLQNDRAKIQMDAQTKVAGAVINARQKAEGFNGGQDPTRQG
jgi:hypothetical protein